MNRIKVLAGVLVVVAGLSGCGGVERQQPTAQAPSESVPATPEPAETESAATPFCASFLAALAGIDGAAWNKAGDELAAIGIPDGASPDEKAGFKSFVLAAQNMAPQQNTLQDQIAFMPFEDAVKLDAFLAYAGASCGS